jgi:hypothetical protein
MFVNEHFDSARTVTKCSVAHTNHRKKWFLSLGVVPHPIRADIEPLGYVLSREQRLDCDRSSDRLSKERV